MAEHKLPDGKRWIANLLELGRALGYHVEDEFDVQDGDSPVDVAWLTSESDEFPMFIFEVESRATGQMTENAGKVFGQDTAEFEKPFFHYHLVLTGGHESNRVATGKKLYRQFNYRIYTRVIAETGTDALCDLLSRHQRVRQTMRVDCVAAVVNDEKWPELDLDRFWRHAEQCGFDVTWETAYAALASTDPAFRERLASRVRSELTAGRQIPSDQYSPGIARSCAPLLHATLVALSRSDATSECFEHAKRWQEGSTPSPLAPRYGNSQEHDELVFGTAPGVWAALAAALGTSEARQWVLDQLERNLGPADRPNPAPVSAVSALWMLHIAASAGDSCRGAFERARDHLIAAGGVPQAFVAVPPSAGPLLTELDAWEAELGKEPVDPPEWSTFEAPAWDGAPREDLRVEVERILAGDGQSLSSKVLLGALWA